LYQDLSVQENLQFFATVFGTTIDANYHLIKDIYSQIEPFKHRQAGKLSGGMKQKLALSCALIHAPKLLVLDEPTTGVDAVSRKEFWEMLKRLKEQNISIIVSTPYMDEAVLCDRVALMQNGKLLQIDTPQNIMDSFPHLLYNVKSDNMAALIKDVEAYPNTQSVFIFGQHLHYIDKNENADIQQLRAYLTNKNHSSISIEKGKADIEDCFMALMTK